MKYFRAFSFLLLLVLIFKVGQWSVLAPFPNFEIMEQEQAVKEKAGLNKEDMYRFLSSLDMYFVDEIDKSKLIEKSIASILNDLDPHAALFTPTNFKNFNSEVLGEFGGVGMTVSKNKTGSSLVVDSVIKGGPAFKKNIRPKDEIISVGLIPVNKMTLEEAIDKIRGVEGGEVLLEVKSNNEKLAKQVSLIREIVKMKSTKGEMLSPAIGYISIDSFQENTLSSFLEEFKTLDVSHLKGLVLDLRGNPGGIIDSAVDISSLFLSKNVTVVTTEGRSFMSKREYKTKNIQSGGEIRKLLQKIPLVVLTDINSASASEIVAAALQEYKRATIIGTPTFGKGTVQTIFPLNDGYAFKMTISRYFTPSGKAIQSVGVTPDIKIQSKWDKGFEAFSYREKDIGNRISVKSTHVNENNQSNESRLWSKSKQKEYIVFLKEYERAQKEGKVKDVVKEKAVQVLEDIES